MQTATKQKTDRERIHSRSPMRPDEELLVTYAETGNRDAFEELVHRYERELYGYLQHYLGDVQLAEDAFQTTFLQVHLKCRQFAPGRRLRPWLYRIAANQAVDLLRRNRRHKAVSLNTAAGDSGHLLESEEADPNERLQVIENRQWTRLAVQRLSAKVRQVLLLVIYKGLSYREAADVLDIPLGTVKSRMNKALRDLRETLIATKHDVSIDNRQNPCLRGAKPWTRAPLISMPFPHSPVHGMRFSTR